MKRRSEAVRRPPPSHCQPGENWRSSSQTVGGRSGHGSREDTMATMSYDSDTSDFPLIGNTIGQQLEETARRFPDRLALAVRQQRVRFTWRELDAEVDKLAAGLLALGLAPGDRGGIWSPK